MISGIFTLVGVIVGAVLTNCIHILHKPNSQIEEQLYRNGGHYGPED
jgi:hypothetical protein